MPLKGHPESFQFNETGSRIFVNVPQAREITVVDAGAGRQISTLNTAGARSNFPMAVDVDEHRLLVVFRSPAVYKPYQGSEQVEMILRLVATVFENFRYTNEWRDGRTTILFFEANVGEKELQGIDILEENEAGEIEKFTVMIRPLSGLQAVAGTMAARLGLA